ncbi:MAG: hypothetical protein ACREYB_03190 [Casimicrobiaceae bacterium]
MFTDHSSKSITSRVGTSLKVGVLLVLLGLIVVATERPMLLAPAGAVTNAEQASAAPRHATAAGAAAVAPAGVAAAGEIEYFPSRFPAPNGPVEDLPPQF